MNVWILTADNHDYDMNSAWFVGVYSSLDKVAAGARADFLDYAKQNGGKKKARREANYTLVEATVDGDELRGAEIDPETGHVQQYVTEGETDTWHFVTLREPDTE